MTDEPPQPFHAADGDHAEDVIAGCRDKGAVRPTPYGHDEFFVQLPRRPGPCWMSAALLDGCLRL